MLQHITLEAESNDTNPDSPSFGHKPQFLVLVLFDEHATQQYKRQFLPFPSYFSIQESVGGRNGRIDNDSSRLFRIADTHTQDTSFGTRTCFQGFVAVTGEVGLDDHLQFVLRIRRRSRKLAAR